MKVSSLLVVALVALLGMIVMSTAVQDQSLVSNTIAVMPATSPPIATDLVAMDLGPPTILAATHEDAIVDERTANPADNGYVYLDVKISAQSTVQVAIGAATTTFTLRV
jgi:hypothetical protein